MTAEELIPHQQEGGEKHSREMRNASSEAQALLLFDRAKTRLLDVNRWHELTQGPSACFVLSDAGGHTLQRLAREGDLVRIDLPGPHRASASGYDWVVLDAVREGEDEEGPWAVLTTRPAPDPAAPEQGAAHFFSDKSTGTFIIRKRGAMVSADHYDRNISANTAGGRLLDKARALLVSAGASLGLSDLQWSKLIKGLLVDMP
jgi:hypothetical protein